MGTRANLLAGPGLLYTAPTGTSLPELNDIDSGLISPASPWSQIGFRLEPGLEVEYSPKIDDVVVEEHLGPVKAILTAENCVFSTTLAERDMAAYQKAISAITASQTAAATDQAAQDLYGVGDGTLTEVSLLFIGKSPEGYSRAIYASVAVANAKIKDTYTKKHTGLQCSWMILANPAETLGRRLFRVIDITAVPTA